MVPRRDGVTSLAAYPKMMRRDRNGLGLRECRAAWLARSHGSRVLVIRGRDDPLLVSRV